jgi:hypothetical protein
LASSERIQTTSVFEILFEIPHGGKRAFYADFPVRTGNYSLETSDNIKFQGRKKHGPS